jgi:hypothetical protein
MLSQVTWKGSKEEAELLIKAFAANCECDKDKKLLCPSHQAMLEGQRFIDGLLFVKAMRQTFLRGEWNNN